MNTFASRLHAIPHRTFALVGIFAVHGVILYGLLYTPVTQSPPSNGPLVLVSADPPNKPVEQVRPLADPVASTIGMTPQVTTPVGPIDIPVDPIDAGIVVTTGQGASGNETPSVSMTPMTFHALRSPNDRYPPSAIRLSEQGVVTVRACVDAQGKLQGMPIVEGGSGYADLDRAAVQWIREDLRFTPAMRGGSAVASCKGFRVNFQLR